MQTIRGGTIRMADEEKKSGRVIVLGYDGSDNAKFAMNYYAEHIRKSDDSLIVVYSVEISDVLASAPFSLDHEAYKALVQHESKKIQERLAEFAEYMKEHRIHGTLRSTQSHKAGEGVVKIAEESKADLIITGTRGQGKIRRTLMGSVSDYIVHHATVPILVCRQ